MAMLSHIKSQYNYLFYEVAHPGLANFPLMSGGLTITFISILYLYIIKVALPGFMKNRQPYNLDKVISAYNTFQIIVNFIVGFGMLSSGWYYVPYFYCHTIDFYNAHSLGPRMSYSLYGYFVLKMIELIETGFFILRKKDKQATNFHIFHHIFAMTYGWLCCKYCPYGGCSFPAMLNAFMHSIMYTYYQAVLICNDVQKKWIEKFKSWLTVLQMAQLIVMFSFCTYMAYNSCPTPKWTFKLILPMIFIVQILFVNFYRKTYIKKKR